MDSGQVIVGQYYKHVASGKVYCVTDIANEHAIKWPVIVVYVDDDRKVWARPMSEFVGGFEGYEK